ncbi:MAG: hypothetical protein LBI45_06355 [Bacteroidales bacterium]|jgi:hypothetical protein|nr:hypothetical protein [Bacteroidales bacterium]
MLFNKTLFILPLFPLLFFSFACKRKQTETTITPDALKNHLQRANLFGNVKSIETEHYYFSKNTSSFVFADKRVQCYNSDGYLTKVITLDESNDTISLLIINYLSNTKEDYRKEITFRKKIISIDTLLYDKNGFKSEERHFVNDSLHHRIVYKTDGIGSIIEMKRFFSDYQLTNKIYYNNLGLVERIDEFDPQNKLFKYFIIEYDESGNEINRRALKSNNEIIEFTYSQYDKNGFLLKIIYEDRITNLREDKIYSNHDEKGNWFEEILIQGKDTLRKKVRNIVYY